MSPTLFPRPPSAPSKRPPPAEGEAVTALPLDGQGTANGGPRGHQKRKRRPPEPAQVGYSTQTPNGMGLRTSPRRARHPEVYTVRRAQGPACSGSRHHHFGSSSSRSDLLISSVRRSNCPGNRPTAQPSPNGWRGSRKSPGGNRSPTHSWFYQTETGTASPLSKNPSPTRTPAAKEATPNAPNR